MLDTSQFTSDGRASFARNNPVKLLLLSDCYADVPLRAVYVVLTEPAGCTSISLGQHVVSSWAR